MKSLLRSVPLGLAMFGSYGAFSMPLLPGALMFLIPGVSIERTRMKRKGVQKPMKVKIGWRFVAAVALLITVLLLRQFFR